MCGACVRLYIFLYIVWGMGVVCIGFVYGCGLCICLWDAVLLYICLYCRFCQFCRSFTLIISCLYCYCLLYCNVASQDVTSRDVASWEVTFVYLCILYTFGFNFALHTFWLCVLYSEKLWLCLFAFVQCLCGINEVSWFCSELTVFVVLYPCQKSNFLP